MTLSQPSRTIVVEPVRGVATAPAPVEPPPAEAPREVEEPATRAPTTAKA